MYDDSDVLVRVYEHWEGTAHASYVSLPCILPPITTYFALVSVNAHFICLIQNYMLLCVTLYEIMFSTCHSFFQIAFVDSSLMLTHVLHLVSHTFALLMCVLAWKLMRPNFSKENSLYEQSKWNLTACISETSLCFFYHNFCSHYPYPSWDLQFIFTSVGL